MSKSVSLDNRRSTVTPPHSPSQSKLSHPKSSPKLKSTEPQLQQQLQSSSKGPKHSPDKMLSLPSSTSNPTDTATNRLLYDDNLTMQAAQSAQYQFYEPMNELAPDMYGLGSNDWLRLDVQTGGDDDQDILARVLAASQQEYLESLKAKRQNQHT